MEYTDWRLRFSTSKCESLTVTRKRNPIEYQYTLNGESIKRVASQKDLGVTISSDLKWTTHIENSVAKGSRMLGFLRRHISKDFDARTRRALYLTLVRPSVRYASEVWSPTSISNLRTVESLQRRASRFILNYPDISYRDRLNQLDLQSQPKVSGHPQTKALPRFPSFNVATMMSTFLSIFF